MRSSPSFPRNRLPDGGLGGYLAKPLGLLVFLCLVLVVLTPIFVYTRCRIQVDPAEMAVLIKKTGQNLPNGVEIAPDATYKGVQREVLREGRRFYNPFVWSWVVVPQLEIPEGKVGVRIRLHGENLPQDELIAKSDEQKGIVEEVLRSGRHPINGWLIGTARRQYDSYAEYVELHDMVTVPAGFKGIVTNLSGPLPENPNTLLAETGQRGVLKATLDPGTYPINPYVQRINLVDCRSQRFNLASTDDATGTMGFPSKDGFWVTLDGIIEFRVKPDEAASVYVTYNDEDNGEALDDEIVNKIILPNARSFCRLQGSNHSGKDFISGETRTAFEKDFQQTLELKCESQGVEIVQALITKIHPPDQIAKPVRERQIALQTEQRYVREIQQQLAEQELAIQTQMVEQKRALIEIDQEVIKLVTEANREQEVALIEADKRLSVAEFELQAATDLAAAITARGTAAAAVIRFDNEATAAGWKRTVEAFDNDGDLYARWAFLQKMAPAFRSMMVNTADSPLMDIFGEYDIMSARHKPLRSDVSVKPEEEMGELDELFLEPTEPIVEPTEPVEPIVEPAEPVVEPAEPVVEPAEPVVEPAEPVVEPTEPVVEPTEPVVEPTEPVVE